MPGVQADAVIVSLEARITKYQNDLEAAAKKTEDVFKRIRNANKPVSLTTSNKSTNATAEKEALRTEGVRRREAEKTAGQIERLEARKAAAAEKAAARVAAANEKAAQRAIAASQKAVDKEIADQARIAAAVEAGVAKSNAIAQGSGLGGSSGSRVTVAAQTRLMSGTSLSAVAGNPVEDRVNYLLRDQIDLRTKIGAAIAAGEAKAVTALNDELTLLRLIDQYKRAGLSETDAAVRAEQALAAVVKGRSALEANAALEQQANAAKGVAGTGRVANGYRNLGRQIADVGTSVAGGLNPFLIIAQQAPQVADALTDTGGKAARVAAFFAGPWGAALLAAGSIAGLLASKIDFTGDALEGEIDKLKENARQTDLSSRAKEAFASTEQGLIADVSALTKEIKDQNDALKTNAERLNIKAKTDLAGLQGKSPDAQSQLDAARKDLEAARATAGTDESGQVIATALKRVADAEKRVNVLNTQIAAAQAAIQSSRADLAAEAATRANDPVERIKRLYDGPDGLIAQAKKQAIAEGVVTNKLTARLSVLQKERDARIAAVQAQKSAEKKGPGPSAIGRTVNVAEATDIVRGIGGRVTSGYRSNAEQTRIYNDKLAGRHAGPVAVPGTSDHERGQAIDVAFGPGISVASLRKAFADAGVRVRQILPEKDQRVFHVAFGAAGKSAQAIASDAERQRAKQVRNNDAFDEQNLRLDDLLLSAKGKQAQSIEEQADQAVADAEIDNERRKRGFQSDFNEGRLSEAGLRQLQLKSDGIAATQTINAALEKQAALAKQQADLDIQSKDFAISAKEAELGATKGREARARLEDEILDLKYEERRLQLEANIADAQRNKDKVAEQRARDDLALLPAQKKAEIFQNAENRKGPIQQFRDSLDDPKLQVQQAVADKLRAVDEGITNAIADKLGIKDPFLKQLLQTFIEQNILKPLYDAVAQAGNGGSSGGGFFGAILNAAKTFLGAKTTGGASGVGGGGSSALSGAAALFGGGRASGGDVSAGKLYQVNETGIELFQPAQSGKIIPTGRATANRGSSTIIQPQINVDARGAVMNDEFARQILARANKTAKSYATQAGYAGAQGSKAVIERQQILGT